MAAFLRLLDVLQHRVNQDHVFEVFAVFQQIVLVSGQLVVDNEERVDHFLAQRVCFLLLRLRHPNIPSLRR